MAVFWHCMSAWSCDERSPEHYNSPTEHGIWYPMMHSVDHVTLRNDTKRSDMPASEREFMKFASKIIAVWRLSLSGGITTPTVRNKIMPLHQYMYICLHHITLI
jgi:hypothetical protein